MVREIGQWGSLPGAEPHRAELIEHLQQMAKRRGAAYQPRTEHLRRDGGAKYYNRLFLESSPYLLQHAHNPVNWYPWGDEAFADAQRLDRPIFLSVGYSTCHWCHVMEEESFENLEIAEYLNHHYIAIKLDREERPDLDAVYMAAVQAMTGRGGWPMNVWLDHDRKPFFGGTYFPPQDGDRGVGHGFLTVLTKLYELYQSDRPRIRDQSSRLAGHIRGILGRPKSPESKVAERDVLDEAFRIYLASFDERHGGLAGAPKFPSSLPVRFLLRYYRRSGNPQAMTMVSQTLDHMAHGGIYDQVAGGFHRYATDDEWLVPHFEKMLYDNALLATTYLEAYHLTGNENYQRVVTETLDYVSREMTAESGGFFSATDADSLGPEGIRVEGHYFTWTPSEILAVLNSKDATLLAEFFGVTDQGNFEGRNILNRPQLMEEFCRAKGLSPQTFQVTLDQARKTLNQARQKRPQPSRDEKILTAWNGLMISAFARAGFVLQRQDYLTQAVHAADFIQQKMQRAGHLYRCFKDDQARFDGFLEDYAFLIGGLIDLFEATQNRRWLAWAIDLDKVVSQEFEDAEMGGFFMTAEKQEQREPSLVREKPGYDGAEPSGNSVAVLNLLRLASLTADVMYRHRAERTLAYFSTALTRSPNALSEMLLALDYYYSVAKDVVIVAPPKERDRLNVFLDIMRREWLPNCVLFYGVHDQEKGGECEWQRLASLAPILRDKGPVEGKTTAFVCQHGMCQRPVQTPEEFREQLRATDA